VVERHHGGLEKGLFPAGYVVESATPNEAEVPPLRKTSTEEQNSDHACFTGNEFNLIEPEYILDVGGFDDGLWME